MPSGGTAVAKPGFQDEALPHMDAVYRFALRLTGTADEAEDLLQETFLRAYRSWEQYTRGTSAKSWLFTICRNVFLRGVERAQRHQRVLAEVAEPLAANEETPVWGTALGADPEGRFFDSIVDERILQAIEALPEEYRSTVVMSDVEGLSYGEIAESMGVPVGTVKSRLSRGRRRLQAALEAHAVEMGYIKSRSGAG